MQGTVTRGRTERHHGPHHATAVGIAPSRLGTDGSEVLAGPILGMPRLVAAILAVVLVFVVLNFSSAVSRAAADLIAGITRARQAEGRRGRDQQGGAKRCGRDLGNHGVFLT
jgi:hypothetical protein